MEELKKKYPIWHLKPYKKKKLPTRLPHMKGSDDPEPYAGKEYKNAKLQTD